MTYPTIDEIVDHKVATQLSEDEALALFDEGLVSYEKARDGITLPENNGMAVVGPVQFWWM